jgi:hypothetical protein
MPASKLSKSVSDAGYIAIGLGVMGVQQAQERARKLRARASATGDCVNGRIHDARVRFQERSGLVRDKAQAKAYALRGEVEKRVEPMVGQVQTQLTELPERVVEALEPVAARVRELTGNAA